MDAQSQAGKAGDRSTKSEDVAEPAEPPTDNAGLQPDRPGAGPAYFLATLASEHELVRLSVDGQFGVVPWPADGGRYEHGRLLRLDRAGQAFYMANRALYRIDGDALVDTSMLKPSASTHPVDEIAFAEDGSLWTVGRDGARHLAQGTWRFHAAPARRSPGSPPDMVVAANGAWILGFGGLYHMAADSSAVLKQVDTSKILKRSHDRLIGLIITPAGVPYTAVGLDTLSYPESAVFVRLDGPDDLVPIPISADDFTGTATTIAASPTGSLLLGGPQCDVIRFDLERPDRAWRRSKDQPWGCDFLHSIHADASDRVWVSSYAGLHVEGPADESKSYPIGSIPELIGGLYEIVVVGSGPATLPEPGPILRGALSGTIVLDDEPLPHATFELCPKPKLHKGDTPCSHSPIRVTAVTDAAGNFRVEDIPVGMYDIAVKYKPDDPNTQMEWLTGGLWDRMHTMPAKMKGRVYAVGDVTLTSD